MINCPRSRWPLLLLVAAPVAAADPYRLVEDASLPAADHALITKADLAPCLAGAEPTGSAVFWLDTHAHKAYVHGAGRLDACFTRALEKASTEKSAVIVIGHIDVMEKDSSKFLPSPRISTTPVMIDRHNTKWQLTIEKLAYTANRAADIAQALDGISAALSDCADKRETPAELYVFTDGHAVAHSGVPAYDACISAAVSTIKLPAPESALWMQLSISAPAEALAPRGADAKLTHAQALKDGLASAVRAHRLDMLECLPKGVTLTKVTASLRAEKAAITGPSTGDATVDACVKSKLDGVKIPSAKASDVIEVEVELN